jgi:hypothetical protein
MSSSAPESAQLSLLVLAAGMGSRYGGLKQIEPVGPHGESILDYSVHDALRAGFDRIVFVIRRDFAELFARQVLARYTGKVAVSCVFQDPFDLPPGFSWPAGRTKPWGTLHAVLAARHLMNGYFAVVNADDYYGQAAYRAMAEHHRHWLTQGSPGRSSSMVAYQLDKTLSSHGGVNRGICSVRNGLLTGVEEITDIRLGGDSVCHGRTLKGQVVAVAPDAPASMNFWGFAPQVLPDLQAGFAGFLHLSAQNPLAECYIPSVVSNLIGQGRLDCHVLGGGSDWFGVTYPQDKTICRARIQQLIQRGVYPRPLWA